MIYSYLFGCGYAALENKISILQEFNMRSRKSAFLILLSFGLLLFAGAANDAQSQQTSAAKLEQKKYVIGIHWWKPGKIYTETYQGLIDGLNLKEVDYRQLHFRAQHDKKLAINNFRKMDSSALDIIISLSSAGSRIAAQSGLKTPVVALVVNHPQSLGINNSRSNKETPITGCSYYIDASRQLDFFLRLFSHLKRIGMIFDRHNPAGYLAEEPLLSSACTAKKLEFFSSGITRPGDLQAAARELLDQKQVDIIVIPTNRVVYANLELILPLTDAKRIPLVSMNKQGVEYGALAALYADPYKLGRLAASQVIRILKKEKSAADLPFQYIDQPEIIINLKAADRLHYTFPPIVLGQASIVRE